MSAPEFIKLVKQMREAQKNYFKSNRSNHYLELSKELERKVDLHIKEVENIQIPLF